MYNNDFGNSLEVLQKNPTSLVFKHKNQFSFFLMLGGRGGDPPKRLRGEADPPSFEKIFFLNIWNMFLFF